MLLLLQCNIWKEQNDTMGQRKGQTGNKNGRPKGIPNKATTGTREFLNDFLEKNQERMLMFLDDMANGIKDPADDTKYLVKPNPEGAFLAVSSLIEYATPKLSRVTQVGDKDAPVAVTIVNDIPKE